MLTSTEPVRLTWYPAPGNAEAVMAALKAEGAPVRGGLGLEPITMIATGVARVALGRALLNLYKDARYKGVLIDATGDTLQVREMPGWSRSEVLVVTPKGTQFYRPDADPSVEDSLTKLADFVGKFENPAS